jgi:hypothetical protein
MSINQNKSAFLKKICPNSNVCFALGAFTNLTNSYFDNMSYKHAIEPIKKVGNNSANGFIREIVHEKNGYIAKTLLKSAQNEYSDNLIYEYVVGQYINKLNTKFPCFLNTYACYKYSSMTHYNTFEKNMQKIDDLNNLTLLHSSTQLMEKTKFENAIKDSCKINKMACISIQYFENPISLYDLVKKHANDIQFLNFELVYLLAQIYIPLGVLSETFTHNDLHANNVLIYTIPNNKFVTMTYNTPLGVVTFKTKYVCKIIDYGRSYFSDTSANISSSSVISFLCGTPSCGPTCSQPNCVQGNYRGENSCGSNYGYQFADQKLGKFNYYSSLLINNQNKDVQNIVGALLKYALNSDSYVGNPLGVNILLNVHQNTNLLNISLFSNFCIKLILDSSDKITIKDRYPTMTNLDEYGTFTIDATKKGNDCNEYSFSLSSENAKEKKPSTVNENRVPKCKPKYEINTQTNRCIKSCTALEVRNVKTNRCNIIKLKRNKNKSKTKKKPKSKLCPQNKEWYSPKRRCRVSCTSKQYRSQTTGRCNKQK